jgi:hypothetical protein
MNIDTDEDFPEHPKTVRFCALLGNPVAWSYIWKLWRFCKKFRPTGDLTGLSSNEIEMAVGWTSMDGKFFAAAVNARFIDHDARGTRVHNWMRRMGASIIRMEIDRLRKAADRAKRAGDTAEAQRLEGLVATLRARLAAEGTRTSDGHPLDVQRPPVTSEGQASDVRHPSVGQDVNGAGPAADVQRMSRVSDLICSDLPDPTTARDPTEHQPVAPSTGTAPPPAALLRTGYGILLLIAKTRHVVFPNTLPWETPPDKDGKTAAFAARLTEESWLDVEPTMLLAWRHIEAGDDDWTDARFVDDVAFVLGSWRYRFQRLREELHDLRPTANAKTKARPGEIRYDPI